VKLSFFVSVLFAAALGFFAAHPARAQEEGAATVVDEVIAQVNNDVVTLSLLKRENEDAIKALMEQRGMTQQQAAEEVRKSQPRVIASLINEQLLLQRGEELGLRDEVEAQVNRQMLAEGQRLGLKTMDEIEKAMREQGLDPGAIRSLLRREIMKNAVLGREVDAKIFYGISTAEAQKYFNEHRKDFQKPETITISEIFLSLAGRNDADVKAKAAQLVAQARAGANFRDLAVANSERLDREGNRFAVSTGGKLGTFGVEDVLKNLKPEVAAAVKNLQAGGVTDPIRTDEGYIILRIDERTPVSEGTFNENQVKERMTYERAEKAHEEYIANLRKEAYIKVADAYQADVMPLLKNDSQKSANNYLSPIRRVRKTEPKKN
jgi:peptidyl-prolyl cis-trans isomerase SurA